MDDSTLLAVTGEDGLPTFEDAADGLTDLLAPYVPDRLEFLVSNLVSPGLTILLILVLAVVLSSLAKRGIRRLVGRMRSAERPDRRWRGRIGLDDAIETDLRRAQRADALGAVARSAAVVVIWSMALIMALGQIGLQLGPLIAGAGIIGVAVGFGAQDLVKDFLSGVFMLVEDQYGVGDIIDAGEASGVVEGITLRSTRIRDVNGTLWHVPNGEIRRVGNMSQGWARALLDVSVAYGTDVDLATQVIDRVAVTMAHEDGFAELFLEDPEVWGVERLGADGIDIRLVIKVVPGKQWAIARELRRRVKVALDDAGVEIPFPQRTVWLRTERPVAVGDEGTPTFEPAGRVRATTPATTGPGGQDATRVRGEYDDVQEEVVRSDDELR